MPTTPSSDDTVLALGLPRMPGATMPVEGAHYGVPKRIYDLEPMGARVEVDPYVGQEKGDTVLLNLNGQTGIDSKQTQSDDSITTLYIPKRLLLPDIVNQLTYTVTRGSQNEGTSEPPLELLYNLIRPGNQDRDPGVDGHSELELLLPDEIKNGVGPDFPVAGVSVCVSYPYCRAYDVIRLNLNGHDVYHTVTPLEAPLPGSATPVKVCFTVTRADLAAGGDHAQFRISYTVTDQLGNGPDPDSPWSATQVVDVDLAGNRLPAPLLRERMNDPGDDPKRIELEKLGGNPLLVVIVPRETRFQKDDVVNATYLAKIIGQPDVRVEVTGVIEQDEFGIFQPCVMYVPNDKVIAGSKVEVKFDLLRNNVVIANSSTAKADVIGQSAIELRAPFLVAPATDPIDVLAYATGVTVRVEHLTAENGDKAHLVEVNPLPDTPAFPSPVLNANHRANFNLSPAFLAARQGRAVELKWELIRNGVKVAESPVLALTVSRIVDGDKRLPTPTITAVTDGVTLDLTSFTGDTSELVQAWPGIVVGQRLWMSCEGTTSSGAPVTLQIHQGTAIGSTGDQSGDVTGAFLDQLGNGTQINVFAAVNFSEVANEATAVKFPVRTYTVRAVAHVNPTITSVKGSPSNVEIPPGGTTVETSVILTGKASGGMTVQLYNGTTAIGSVITVAANGDWTTTLPGLSANTTYTIKARALYGAQPESAPRAFTVTAVITPTLSSVKGSPSGVEIPDNRTTVETSVTLTGTASKGQQVEIFDGSGSSAVSKGTVTADVTTGIWELRNIPAAQGAHRLYAQSRYHSTPTFSNVRHLTVTAVVAPTITSVKGSPSNVEIPPGGTTVETSVILTGKASGGMTVQLYNGTTAIGSVITVAANGDWTTTLPGLSANTTYTIKARALYGAQPDSAARTLTVRAVVAPTITSVKGSPSNVEIPPGGTTVETSVILTGKASGGMTVQLYNGTTAIGSVITVAANGDWTTTLPGLSANTTYTIKARALYGAQPESAARALTVRAVVAPTITSVKGSPSNVEIPPGGTTVETSVILTGKASGGMTVQLYNGTTAIGSVITVAANGDWTTTLPGLSANTTYTIKARALYGAQPDSAARTLTVRAVVAPTITSVKGSPSNVEIPPGGTTVETSVILTGKASGGMTVQLYNGTTAIGSVITVAANGDWTTTLPGLSANTTYTIKARALYGAQPDSAARTLTVRAVVAPTITSVKGSPSNVEIPPGGTTINTSVILTGKASGGMTVQLYNGTTAIGPVITVAANGDWATTLTGLSAKTTYTIKAQALYGTRPESLVRTFIVVETLQIPSPTMALDGVKLIPDGNYGLTAKEVRRNTDSRVPIKGNPPYTYRSEVPAIASVSADGKVTGLKNGVGRITITDATNQSDTYYVQVTNIYRLRLNDSYLTAAAAANWLRSVGAQMISMSNTPIGFGAHWDNFTNVIAIYGSVGAPYGRWYGLSLENPSTTIYYRALNDSNGAEGGAMYPLTSTETFRSLAHIPT